MRDDDPAAKYVPKPKPKPAGGDPAMKFITSGHSFNTEHGVFTAITYIVAWAVAGIGTLVGLFQAFQDNYVMGQGVQFMLGMGTILGAWVCAAAIGTLAEISRKLTSKP